MTYSLEQQATLPPGFRYVPGVLDVEVERALIDALELLDYEPYVMHGVPSRRGVCFFGATYGRTAQGPAPPVPAFLLPVREVACALAGERAEDFVQALVNRYPPGAGIGWHRDIAAYGPTVIGVSLGAPCRLRFRHPDRPRRVLEQVLAPRSVYIIGGEARAEWQHHIPPQHGGLRWSITFRTVKRRP